MENLVSLNGVWTLDYLSEEPYLSKEEPQSDATVAVRCPVPGYWEDMTEQFRDTPLYEKLHWNPLYTPLSYPQTGYVSDMFLRNPVGCFVYGKSFALTTLPREETVLYVGGAQNTVSAWLNGVYLGRHEGYSAPFSFPVPEGILKVGENRITLAVSNNRLCGYAGRPVSGLTSRAANECTGGIYGDVALCTYPNGLKDLWVTTGKDSLSFTVHVSGARNCKKTVRILDGENCIHETVIPEGETECTLDASRYTPWSPDTPKLYTAEVSTDDGSRSVRFGIRRLTVSGTRLLLNGEPYFFRGVCEHCYQPKTVHPTRDPRYYRAVIERLKSLGFNSIRFHTWVPPYEYMDAADELGMLMEIESPNNTSFAEWREIVRFCRTHAAVCLYSTGNELQIDTDYEVHLKQCADLVHAETDSLFSPMSAMRGIEYHFTDEDEQADEPFCHNPRRLAAVSEYCDVYNSYSNKLTSYASASGTHGELDRRNAIYRKPLLSHEICIHGTYVDLALEERYRGLRIGETALMSSVRQHLEEKGLLQRADLYYRNSAAWQRLLRKHCFETVRRCESFAGYDFLGDIDTHWHTFGYCVGMMNEFYELKAGETAENVLRYNGETVLLADLPANVNMTSGETVEIPILVSHYGETIPNALLQIRVKGGGAVLYHKEIPTGEIPRGTLRALYRVTFGLPQYETPMQLKLCVSLSAGETECENCWDLYVFPKTTPFDGDACDTDVTVLHDCDADALRTLLCSGKKVVLFGTGPFPSVDVSWQISVAGRTNGHLATVIADHPLTKDLPHDGYCGRQFERMMNRGKAAILDTVDRPHRPIIDIASSYKNAHREGLLFEYRIDRGKLLVCTLNTEEDDPAARWLKAKILSYATSEDFSPKETLSIEEFYALCNTSPVTSDGNCNEAMNKNDITM